MADDDDAYAVPLSDYYDGEQSLLRVSEYGGDSAKGGLDSTETLTFVCYEASSKDSDCVQVHGPLRERRRDVDER
ncbi:hypothetical protein [Halorubrum sp. N11]|uniref:hypothetical protein n=1 Tax=Halorubrum sp. N11 TaxID=3402276 RepID=UPI003EBB6967